MEIFPELGALLRRRAGLLCGGEQMLALARVLAAEPSVLLLDELSLGLAPVVVSRLFSAVAKAAERGAGVLLIEQHTARALEIADRVYVLNRGRVVLAATSADLRRNPEELYRSYLHAESAARTPGCPA